MPGPADKSYGIHVARLAGLPKDVINRSKEILLKLESEGIGHIRSPFESDEKIHKPLQLELFSKTPFKIPKEIQTYLQKLSKIDSLHLTPMEAIQLLHDLVTESKKLNEF